MFLGPLLSPAGIDFRQILPVHYKVHFFSFQKLLLAFFSGGWIGALFSLPM